MYVSLVSFHRSCLRRYKQGADDTGGGKSVGKNKITTTRAEILWFKQRFDVRLERGTASRAIESSGVPCNVVINT